MLGESPATVIFLLAPLEELNSTHEEPPLSEYHHLLAVAEEETVILIELAVMLDTLTLTLGAARSILLKAIVPPCSVTVDV